MGVRVGCVSKGSALRGNQNQFSVVRAGVFLLCVIWTGIVPTNRKKIWGRVRKRGEVLELNFEMEKYNQEITSRGI